MTWMSGSHTSCRRGANPPAVDCSGGQSNNALRPKRTTGVVTIGKTRALAGWFDISEAVLATVRDAGGIEGAVIGSTSSRGKSIAA